MFTCYRDGGEIRSFGTLDEAITWGRERESFEVYDEDDRQVFAERPQSVWA
jgi:hypothetical protein